MYKPTSVYMDGSRVYGGRYCYRYREKYNRWLRYNQDTDVECYTAIDCNQGYNDMCESTSVHVDGSRVHGGRYCYRYREKYYRWL